MDNRKKRRIEALEAMNGWMNIEMSDLRQTQRQANDRLHVLAERIKVIDGEISEAESCVRAALDPGANLILEEYQMLLTYLDHKQRIRVNNERQHGFARDRLVKIEDEMTQQGLKIRGMENLLERRQRELELDKDNKQLSLLDEAWLQKQRNEG
ncbi:MAG: hypothetical protein PVJ68_01325 [Candidatus Thiodiazotropha sp.]|jgi:hypothetical protein